MTDKEIIKGLKCCLGGKEELCKECPFNGECYGDVEYLFAYALGLINHQQEQLEAAIAGQETLQKALAKKDKEVERLNNNISAMAVTMHNCAKATRAKAIRTFAERLKEALPMECRTVVEGNDMEGITDTGFQEDDTMTTIDNLVKEMAGDKE